jgi:hypothetical protein
MQLLRLRALWLGLLRLRLQLGRMLDRWLLVQ